MNGFSLRRPLKRLAAALHRGRRSAAPSNHHRCRLVLESLEGRWVRSTVLNLNDAGAGSLRQAILDTPPGGTVDFQPGLSGTITLTSGELLINKDLTIAGPGADVLTVSGNHASRVFDIDATFTVPISGLTITQGVARSLSSPVGGGILNAGILTLSRCTLSGSFALGTGISPGRGGGISNSGTLTVMDSTISGNTATPSHSSGGGIDNEGTLLLMGSTVSGNNVSTDGLHSNGGGGIYNGGTLTITNSTLSGNTAGLDGGGIYNGGTLTISSSTLSGNSAGSVSFAGGGGLYDSGSTPAILEDIIVARNTGPTSSPDLSGPLNSQGHNLIGNSQGGSGYATTDLLNVDPRLGPLQDNGGPTQTMALLAGSPAIDAGDNTDAPMWDQRGPGFRRVVNGIIDIGAYEVQAHAHNPPTGQPLPSPVPVQTLGAPGGPLLGQPPGLPADPSPLPGAGAPAGQADLLGSDPSLALTADGQAVDAVLVAVADQGQPGASIGPASASDLAPLAVNLLGGP
jgi:hypothetical protein